MGHRNWHIARAKYNKTVADHLDKAGHPDWSAVALFYSALHYVTRLSWIRLFRETNAIPGSTRQYQETQAVVAVSTSWSRRCTYI